MKRNSPSYSLTVRLRYPDEAGLLGHVTSAIGRAEAMIGAVDIVEASRDHITRDITFSARDLDHAQRIIDLLQGMARFEVLHVTDRTFELHRGGKIHVCSKVPLRTRDDLSMAYTPGVARVCRAIAAAPEASFALTIRRNMVAVVTDGSAVLGLGNIGPRAALPVMEGKALLFKEFADVDAFPICLETQDTEKIIETCTILAPTFGGINLEDISSPRCVEIEERLEATLEIPVFHDDQHGTAVVVLASLFNALKIVQKNIREIRVAICGAGAAGQAIAKLLAAAGVSRQVVCDRQGTLSCTRKSERNPVKRWLIENTNPEQIDGPLANAVAGADVFIGVSTANVLSEANVRSMARNPIVFALANPDPEIDPDVAAACATVVATGRSDYPNQINNVLCFPGLFRGMLDCRARRVTQEMKMAAAATIAAAVPEGDLRADYIVPSVFDRRLAGAVAEAVSKAAIESARRASADEFKLPNCMIGGRT